MSDFFATTRTVACQAPLSVGFSQEEYWSGVPFPPSGQLPNPEIEPQSLVSPTLAGGIQFIYNIILVSVVQHSSVQFTCSVVSDSLQPHELQHARPPCPSPTPGVHSNTCPSRRWCHPGISSSVVPFSSLQSFPASGSFQMSQFFTSGAKILEFQLQHQSF